MSIFTRNAWWLAAIALYAVVLVARPAVAQGVDAKGTEAATKAAAEAEEQESGPGKPNPLAFRTDLAIWTFVVFALLFAFLSYFAWPQISAALEERERKIADNIAAAEARLDEAKQVLAEHEAKLAGAAEQVRALLEEAHRDADQTKRSIEEEGRRVAKDELERAKREIDRAKDGAIEALAAASANVAIDLARKVIKDKLSSDEQNQIVREALSKLTATTPSKN